MSSAEGFSALAPAAFGGRRHRGSKKLKLVKKKTVRRMLKKLGMKMGGAAAGPGVVAVPAPMADAVKDAATSGGRRRRGRSTKRRKSLFGSMHF